MNYAPRMSDLVFYVKLFVKPEHVDEWLGAVNEVVNEMAKEDAFIECKLHRDANDPLLFTLYERWAEPSVEAFVANQSKPYRAAYDAKLDRLLQRPRDPQILAPLGEWTKRKISANSQ